MVRIEELTEREKEERKRIRELKEIISELFPKIEISLDNGDIRMLFWKNSFFSGSKYMGGIRHVGANQLGRELRIDGKNVLEKAIKLAETYERRYGGEFTIKKIYEE